MDTLLEVRKDVQAKKEALESSLRSAERDFSRRLNELNSGFEVGSPLALTLPPLIAFRRLTNLSEVWKARLDK